MMDQYFGNDSLEPFESIFIGSRARDGIYMASPALQMRGGGGTSTLSILRYQWFLMVKCYGAPCYSGGLPASFVALATNSDEL